MLGCPYEPQILWAGPARQVFQPNPPLQKKEKILSQDGSQKASLKYNRPHPISAMLYIYAPQEFIL